MTRPDRRPWARRLKDIRQRERLRSIIDDESGKPTPFERFIIGVILINAITLGLEASHPALAKSVWLQTVDHVALVIFVVELGLRIYAHGWSFFRNPWNVFDFVIVVTSTLASLGIWGSSSVLRTLRILRVLRVVSTVPSMREVVKALLSSMQGMAAIAMLLGLLIYVAAVMATQWFGAAEPEHFGNLGTSLDSLFQVMTTEGWTAIADDVREEQPLAWIFFVVYLLVSSFTVLNLFVAVVVRAIEKAEQEVAQADIDKTESTKAEGTRLPGDDTATPADILKEIRELRGEIAELRQRSWTYGASNTDTPIAGTPTAGQGTAVGTTDDRQMPAGPCTQ